LESYDVDPAPLFAAAGLDPALWHEPGARFEDERLDEAWLLAVEATGDPCIGLQVARFFSPASMQALGFAWLTSENLFEAFSRTVRYFRAISDTLELELAVSGETCRLSIARIHRARRSRDQAMDAFWAALISLCRLSTSEAFSPVELHLTRPEPPCQADFFALFRSPIQFAAERDVMTLRRSDIERTLPTANRVLARANERAVADYVAQLDEAQFGDQVKLRIVDELPSGGVEAQDLARVFNMSVRTLQRRLAECGTTYSALLDAARKELALRVIGDEGMAVKEATYLLGFSEPANFTRAFRRWTGLSPTEFRQAQY